MDALLQPITDILGPLGPIVIAGVLGVMMVVIVVIMMLKQPEDPLTKLKKSQKGVVTTGPQKERLRQGARNEQLERFSKFLEPDDVEEMSKRQLLLRQAGYQSRDAVRMFHAAQFILGVAGLLLGIVYTNFVVGTDNMSTQKIIMYTLGPGGIGYYMPQYWVNKRVGKRQEEITQGFPDSLDMLLVCVEAGQSLDQAINRVAVELQASYPALAHEFSVVSYEMKAGKDKVSVLNDMGERCGVQDVSSFVTVLIQSTSFGTSIAEALRVYAGEMRDKRVMRAEEAANKLPTKMTLATMMLTVPPLLLILVGPSAHGITQLGNLNTLGN
ncbi:type II secretion system F family protein [Tateyamaria omphalii]|uniref:type II secretion system F family protein n=1 Tax=Tateyamaria omphalii TaxID=299262 RepID=UPI001C9A1BF0|nr:type II secretion system F family protein [Tateyamaria omphalii]MBY5931856.1 type II secretion system F family protein [Tateyamaria omphalii]